MIYVENQGLKEDAPSDGSNTKITLYQDKWETIPINTFWMHPIYCLVIRQEVPTSRIQRQSEEWTLESFGAICEMKEVSKSEVHSAEYKDCLPRKRKSVDASATKRAKRGNWVEQELLEDT